MDLADMVAAALERSVLPSVIARGAGLRVAAVQDGVAILEVTGSPGAVLPLAARIEALIRAAVPEITGVRITGPAAPPQDDEAGPLVERARRVIDAEINPVIVVFQAEDGIRGGRVTGVQTCALPIFLGVPDLGQGLLRPGMGRLGQRAETVSDLVEPASLLPSLGKHRTQRTPEP